MTAGVAVLRLHADDDVGVAMRAIAAGEALEYGVTARQAIERGHKVALKAVRTGRAVRKYGQPIGVAAAEIAAGEHVHTHNLNPGRCATTKAAAPDNPPWPRTESAVFSGFRRANGAGTRNYVGIVSTVNCSATVVRRIAAGFTEEQLAAFGNVDGVVPITHTSGCGMAADGEGLAILQRTLRGFIRHPNFGGVLVVGLGCEVNQIGRLLAGSPTLVEGEALRTMTIQGAGGTRQAIEEGQRQVRELLEAANRASRHEIPASELVLGLQCGGSDGYSGISANPALGAAADRLVRAGGTVILAETPEIVGAEHLLMQRAESVRVVEQLKERLDWWQQYVARHGATLDNNPSPGNIAGGISTILEKSLGAVAKSGGSPLRAVIAYGSDIPAHGFVFMDSPGYDPCSVTGEIAAGANLVAFTTGLGSVFGARPAPSIKLSSNSELARRMSEDIDFDCGAVLSGKLTITEAGDRLFELLLDTASGKRSASELNGFGDLEFVPWQLGAVL